MKILVVDDETESRRLLAIHLKWAGHTVVEAEDGGDGWEKFLSEQARLVITDWMMPEVDGPELVRRIRANDAKGYTYIVMLTALGAKPQVVTGLEAGADDYLTKPFEADELMARVRIGERILKLEESLLASHQQLEYLALHDGLTSLLNRRALHDHAEAELSRAARNTTPFSVIMLDIDHFKSVNDRFGHAAGDAALRLVASTLTQQVRAYDVVGRWGGEEFLILLPNTALTEARTVAERVREAIEAARLSLAAGGEVQLTASLGVATLSGATTVTDLTQQADTALYRAKQLGRNRVCLAE
jgi:diguanylate cyclase (GGDEF)-like protein